MPVISRVTLAVLLVSAVSCGSVAGRGDPGTAPAAPPSTDRPTTEGDLIKTAGTVLAIDGDRVWLRITARNMGTQVSWNNRIVAAIVGPRTVYPGLGVQRLADAHLKAGDVVTFTFIAADYDTVSGAYPALVIGREGPG